MAKQRDIFVFGSNTAGRHGAGAALTARLVFGAVSGVGEGRTGDAYAIPTKDSDLKPLSLMAIEVGAWVFINYAKSNPDLHFIVTRIGCGRAGYYDAQVAPFFKDAPANCTLPDGWEKYREA